MCLCPKDSRSEADALYTALAAGGEAKQPMHEAFWGDYYGDLTDKFGIQWMINCSNKS